MIAQITSLNEETRLIEARGVSSEIPIAVETIDVKTCMSREDEDYTQFLKLDLTRYPPQQLYLDFMHACQELLYHNYPPGEVSSKLIAAACFDYETVRNVLSSELTGPDLAKIIKFNNVWMEDVQYTTHGLSNWYTFPRIYVLRECQTFYAEKLGSLSALPLNGIEIVEELDKLDHVNLSLPWPESYYFAIGLNDSIMQEINWVLEKEQGPNAYQMTKIFISSQLELIGASRFITPQGTVSNSIFEGEKIANGLQPERPNPFANLASSIKNL